MLLDMKYVILNKNRLEARDVADPVLKTHAVKFNIYIFRI